MSAVETCSLCPRLCRHRCPVASGTGREAAVPAVMAEVLLAWERGRVDDALAREASTLCVDCGACQDHCHLHTPLPDALREARDRLLESVEPDPIAEVDDAEIVAICTDDRPWAPALASATGRTVATLRTHDALGAALLGRRTFEGHAARVRARLAGREIVVASGAVASVLREAGLAFEELQAVVPELAADQPRCGAGASCCGAAGPLVRHHPGSAARMAARYARRGAEVDDSRCAAWLRTCGHEARDAVDRLLEAWS